MTKKIPTDTISRARRTRGEKALQVRVLEAKEGDKTFPTMNTELVELAYFEVKLFIITFPVITILYLLLRGSSQST